MTEKVDKWSQAVTENDHPFGLPAGLFKSDDPDKIAAALQRSAEDPERNSSDPYRTAMSMLDFYMNRAGRNLSASERAALEKTKTLLRERFGKTAS
jgi:hypothetical protein